MAKKKPIEQPPGRGSKRAAVASSPYGSLKPAPTPSTKKHKPSSTPDPNAPPKHKGRPPTKGSEAWKRQKKERDDYVKQIQQGVSQPSLTRPKPQPQPKNDQDDDDLSDLTSDSEDAMDDDAKEVEEDKPEEEMETVGESSSKGKAKDEDVNCPVCNCGQKEGAEGVWVECEQCQSWYHWSCVAPSVSASLENIDKWFCTPCTLASASTPNPLETTYKLSPPAPLPLAALTASSSYGASTPLASSSSAAPAPSASTPSTTTRKSQRATRSKNIDYANLDQHLPASVDRWTKVIAARRGEGKIIEDGGEGGFRRMEAREITDEWVYGEGGMGEPFVVEREEGLGMRMPPKSLTVRDVADLVGPKTSVEVIDCASQSSLNNWNLGQWADYFHDPTRDKVRNVISLEVSESKLGEMVIAPELVRKLDWVEQVWPADMKKPGEYPRVQKYCLMSVERSWTDWHVDFAGSSVFYHVIRGGKTFYFIRPTPANLAAYERWSGSSERQESSWLGDAVDMVYELKLEPGNTAFIPTGWIHAVYTPSDSLVIGGNFLHSLNIPTQLRIYQIELATKVPRKFRYPHFVRLLWLVALHYHALLSSYPSLPPPPSHPLPPSLAAPRVLSGLKQLSSFLIEQTQRFAKGSQASAERKRLAKENIPAKKVGDPVKLSREFRKVVLRAMGEGLDEECFLPHVVTLKEEVKPDTVIAAAAGAAGANGNGSGNGSKRKADALLNGNGAMLPPPTRPASTGTSKHAKIKHAPASSYPYAPFLGALPPFPTSQPTFPPPGSFLPPPPSSSAGAAADAAGVIIGRQTVPIVQQTRMEERIDPMQQGRGAREAEVRESRSTQSVVRRWERDPAAGLVPGGGGGGAASEGGAVIETRTVITIVERVRWIPDSAPTTTASASARAAPPPTNGYAAPSSSSSSGRPSSSPYAAYPSAAAPSPPSSSSHPISIFSSAASPAPHSNPSPSSYQPQGVGPPAAPLPPMGSSTLTAYQAQKMKTTEGMARTNPGPYPAYGYPYHYSLPPNGGLAGPSSSPASAAVYAPSVSHYPRQQQQQQQQHQPSRRTSFPPPQPQQPYSSFTTSALHSHPTSSQPQPHPLSHAHPHSHSHSESHTPSLYAHQPQQQQQRPSAYTSTSASLQPQAKSAPPAVPPPAHNLLLTQIPSPFQPHPPPSAPLPPPLRSSLSASSGYSTTKGLSNGGAGVGGAGGGGGD